MGELSVYQLVEELVDETTEYLTSTSSASDISEEIILEVVESISMTKQSNPEPSGSMKVCSEILTSLVDSLCDQDDKIDNVISDTLLTTTETNLSSVNLILRALDNLYH